MFNKKNELKKLFSVIMIFCLLFQNLIYAYAVADDENSMKVIETDDKPSIVSGADNNENVGSAIKSETNIDETDVPYETINETEEVKSVDDGSILKSDGIYQITNPTTNVEMIISGKGKVLLKAIDKDNERVDILEDKITNEHNFMYKIIDGEEVEESVPRECSSSSCYKKWSSC